MKLYTALGWRPRGLYIVINFVFCKRIFFFFYEDIVYANTRKTSDKFTDRHNFKYIHIFFCIILYADIALYIIFLCTYI